MASPPHPTSPTAGTITIAHLSDPHLGPITGLGLAHASFKRGLGLINWLRKRRAIHRPETTARLVSDILAQRPDHIAVTGDLVNVGLPQEYINALKWLEQIGPPAFVSVVPGNHDAYVRLRRDPGFGRWHAYMTPQDWADTMPPVTTRATTRATGSFPYVRRIGPVALIGLNSGVPMPPFVAAGRLGEHQIGALASILEAAARQGLVRVVMIHHPPLPGQVPRLCALEDAPALAQVLASCGADLVLHGHAHTNMRAWLPARGGPVPVLGVPSISATRVHGQAPLARYNLLRITSRTTGRALIEVIGRGLAQPGGTIVELERRTLVPQGEQPAPGAMENPRSQAARTVP